MLHQNFKQINVWNPFVAENFPKKRIGISARIPPQTPPAGGKSAEAGRIHIPSQMFRLVDPGRIELPSEQCECPVLPLYYEP